MSETRAHHHHHPCSLVKTCCCLSSWHHHQCDGKGDESSLRMKVRVRVRLMARSQGHVVIIERVRVRACHHWRECAMTYHKWTPLPKATGPLMGVSMTKTGKNRQFGYPYPYPHFTHIHTHADDPNLCSCLLKVVAPLITHIPVGHENVLCSPFSFALKTTFLQTLSILQYLL